MLKADVAELKLVLRFQHLYTVSTTQKSLKRAGRQIEGLPVDPVQFGDPLRQGDLGYSDKEIALLITYER